ncbi:pyruvate dehydrogenase (acetyl-transferring) kinase, mitochondrial [Tanacetum coccineum]
MPLHKQGFKMLEELFYKAPAYQMISCQSNVVGLPAWLPSVSDVVHKDLVQPLKDPEREFRSSKKLTKTTSLDSLSFLKLNFIVESENQFEEKVTVTMTEPTMEEYMTTTRDGYGSGGVRPKIDDTETLKKKFLGKYCPPSRTAKKMEEINNFQQERDETLYNAWERFKELLLKCPQHYLTDMQEVIAFYKGLDAPTRLSLDSRGAIPSMKANNLGREIKKVNEKVYASQVGCEICKGPHYTKDCPDKEDGKTLKEAYYTQFGVPYPQGQVNAAAPGYYQRNNRNPLYQERRQSLEDFVSKFMAESARRHEENSTLIKKIRAALDSAIRNQGASIKALEIQIGQMSKVLRERRSGGLPISTDTNPRDHVKSISTTVDTEVRPIRRIEPSRYAVSIPQNNSIVF